MFDSRTFYQSLSLHHRSNEFPWADKNCFFSLLMYVEVAFYILIELHVSRALGHPLATWSLSLAGEAEFALWKCVLPDRYCHGRWIHPRYSSTYRCKSFLLFQCDCRLQIHYSRHFSGKIARGSEQLVCQLCPCLPSKSVLKWIFLSYFEQYALFSVFLRLLSNSLWLQGTPYSTQLWVLGGQVLWVALQPSEISLPGGKFLTRGLTRKALILCDHYQHQANLWFNQGRGSSHQIGGSPYEGDVSNSWTKRTKR